jgi:hypothetical protein
VVIVLKYVSSVCQMRIKTGLFAACKIVVYKIIFYLSIHRANKKLFCLKSNF